jgi:diaminopimelate decarboxylase
MIANRPAAPTTGTYRVSGKHCETDTLIDDVALANPQAGDIIAVQSTGAYNHSMASNYNRLPRPAVVFVREGTARLVSRRETYEDLVHLDIGPDDDAGAPVNLPS